MGWTETDLNAHYERLKMPAPQAPDKPQDRPVRVKYGNKATEVGGRVFASGREARAYQDLLVLQAAGKIAELALQPQFELQPAAVTPWGKKLRAVVYVADFQFREVDTGHEVVVDAKGCKTAAYRIKAKLFQLKYPQFRFEEW